MPEEIRITETESPTGGTEMSEKKKKPKAWSRPAVPEVADAIKRMLEIQAERKRLAEEFSQVQRAIIDGKGGSAHGVRAAIRHINASVRWRKITVKERDYVSLLKGDAQ